MSTNVVFMFSGQGSQYFQMGRELYQKNEVFRSWLDHCDAIASDLLGRSMCGILFGNTDKSKPFDDILLSNPCLVAVEYSIARTLMDSGIEPDYLLGYSLGEIAAATVAEAISLEDGLRLAIGIARSAVHKTVPARMLAILEVGSDIERTLRLPDGSWLTARNFPGNIVVGGRPESIEALKEDLRAQGKIVQDLPVRQGFHTELIDPIEEEVKELARGLPWGPPRLPLVSCLKAGLAETLDEQYVWDLIRGEIRFPETIRWMLSHGSCQFVDVGPSGSLATFVKYLLPSGSDSETWQSLNQFGRDVASIERLLKNHRPFLHPIKEIHHD